MSHFIKVALGYLVSELYSFDCVYANFVHVYTNLVYGI